MQSHLVFSAEKKVSHEFLLACMAMKAVHKLHRPGIRTEETAKQVFAILAKGHPVEMQTAVPKELSTQNPSSWNSPQQ